ncbi:DUF1002 domain-containing protein [Tissierella pigra]|uniref:DUF1002 domain-containing protein n=1 Tax=Tissierella pigra TaxID=2607614 RepID=A0A6N7XV33_9FIRM|nr:DUF1002 domain-containing protein [Tissierella pigra]MBU5428313.1 DUF1002 domain-containing protein [Tissierella pigra]MSU01637.1 DUF1002 domain-containing protein [Tissierella pigra]
MKNKKLIMNITIILSFIFIFNAFAYGDSTKVVTLGKNLNEDQRKQMLNLFNVNKNEATIIEVNNEEERKYLEGVASEGQLGKITISSSYVELLEEGSGIDVQTYNISWATEEMYRSALITAGVKDAKVIAAAPYPVSGTGALTGILKAFEQAAGIEISEEQKKVANEEIIQTGELGEVIGKEKASELIREVKEKVIEKNVKTPEEIKKIIIEIAGKLDINLNTNQIKDIAKLMEKISKLDLNTEQIKEQLKGIGQKLDETLKNNEEVKSLLQKILDAIKEFFNSLFKRK